MQRKPVIYGIILSTFLLFPLVTGNSFALPTGSMREVVNNEKMQLYIVSIERKDVGQEGKGVYVEVILKNLEANPRSFNLFFAKVLDPKGNEIKASPFLSSIIPVRIAPNDILRGELVFAVPPDFDASKLVWEEFDKSSMTVDLNSIKNPPDPVPTSDLILSSNKGKMLSDGRTQLTIHDDLLNKSPTYYIVDLSLKNLSKEPLKYTVTYFFLKDQDGVLYPSDLTNFQSMKNPIKQGELKEGEEVRGQVLFVLPSNVSNVMLIYDESLGLGSYFAVPEFSMLVYAVMAVSMAFIFMFRSKVRT